MTSITTSKFNTSDNVRRLLIYRLGSLGDTVVALPALHLIRNVFPETERRMLTNFNINEKAAPIAALLDGTGLIHGYFRYPYGTRDAQLLFLLAREIRDWRPDLLIYLSDARGRMKVVRDALFLRACGIRRMIGLPLATDLIVPQLDVRTGLYEHRAARLLRCIRQLGSISLDDPKSWDLAISEAERANAIVALAPVAECQGIIVASIGAKISVKDWGDDNWAELLLKLCRHLPTWGIAMIGAPVEYARTELLLRHWAGPKVNLCGRLSLRESAAVLGQAQVYIGHDSGPMHLAAAVGTPCVAVFSAHYPPGEWFPYGKSHKVFYNKVECFGCRLNDCVQHKKKCIMSIEARRVEDAVVSMAHKLIDSTNLASSQQR